MQSIIFSKDGAHVLAGRRTQNTSYCPLFYGVPGGILEVSDTKGSFESACMREVNEEVKIKLKSEKYLTAIIQEYHGSVGVVAMIATSVVGNPDMNVKVPGNEEWKDCELSWYPIDELDDVKLENSLEGLIFLKKEREIFTQDGSSIFWK
jgi:ADP-ribose pyrophosphatase YjhB (NUDIX family)